MASTINADDGVVSGSAGVKTSADNSGVLELQSNGTTQFTLGSSSVVINEAGADVDFRVEGDTDSNLLFVDASTDRVGVGTNAPSTKFHVVGTINTTEAVSFGASYLGTGTDYYDSRYLTNRIFNVPTGSGFVFAINNSDKFTLDSAGNVGIGTSSPAVRVDVQKSDGSGRQDLMRILAGGNSSGNGATLALGSTQTQAGYISGLQTASNEGALVFGTQSSGAYAERARITSGGNFGLGTSSPSCLFHVNGDATDNEGLVKIQNTNDGGAVFFPALNAINTRGNHSYGNVATFSIASSTDADRPSILIYSGQAAHSWQIGMITSGWGTNDEFGIGYRASNDPTTFSAWPTRYFSIATNGNVNIANALSKGSGSFKIDHPLKPETHHLVHSFIEGPQADLIYRGKVALNEGKATINIDVAAGMTEGTFIALCREVQCFTSNESDWDAVRGSVNGNVLTIECQNQNSSATISWMVIGERQDKHMYDTNWTDENGKVIVEPEKPESK